MPVTKVVALGALIVSLASLQARGDAMLSLATTSGDWSGSTSQAWAPTPWGGGGNNGGNGPTPLALGTWSANVQPAPASMPTPAPAPAPAPAASPAPSNFNLASFGSAPAPQAPTSYDAYVNLGSGPFPNAGSLTTGNPLPWYQSQAIVGLFGGSPTAQQRSDFDNTVLRRVEQTFQLSGVPVKLTDDPNAASSAAHTLSVVSNTVNPTSGSVIGMTYLGGNGFHYIDNAAGWAKSVDQLEWIVAHNVSHELMLAFGVGENYDKPRATSSTPGPATSTRSSTSTRPSAPGPSRTCSRRTSRPATPRAASSGPSSSGPSPSRSPPRSPSGAWSGRGWSPGGSGRVGRPD